MCTLWLYALYNVGTRPLLPSIFNCNSRLLIHAYLEALWSHIFCIFVVLSLYVSPYFEPLKAVGTNSVHVDASCSPRAERVSNSVTSHTGWTGWLLHREKHKKLNVFLCAASCRGRGKSVERKRVTCFNNTRVGCCVGTSGARGRSFAEITSH